MRVGSGMSGGELRLVRVGTYVAKERWLLFMIVRVNEGRDVLCIVNAGELVHLVNK